MTQRKTERNRQLIEDYKTGLNMLEVAKIHGISRERVRQILKRYGVPANPPPSVTLICDHCGKPKKIQPSKAFQKYCSQGCAQRARFGPNINGKKAYLLRRDRKWSWRRIGEVLGIRNPCSRASWYARRRDLPWPPHEGLYVQD